MSEQQKDVTDPLICVSPLKAKKNLQLFQERKYPKNTFLILAEVCGQMFSYVGFCGNISPLD